MKNVAKYKIFISGSTNRTMTNMCDVQTCSVAHLNIVVAVVALPDVEAVEVARDVVRRARVRVPVGINLIPGTSAGDVSRGLLLIVVAAVEGRVEALVALQRDMAHLAA